MDGLAILQRLGSGKLVDLIADALVATADEVVTTGNPGAVTIKLTVTTSQQGDPMVIIHPAINRATPKVEPNPGFFFAVEGELHREDPRQIRMDFRAVDTETGEIRQVDDRPGNERRVN